MEPRSASPPHPITIEVPTRRRTDWVEITDRVRTALKETGLRRGSVLVFVPHTTAGVTINENADPDVAADMMMHLDEMVPRRRDFAHGEGNSDSHIKASMMGSSVRVIVADGGLCLGRWQGIFLCEFDGPRRREVWISAQSGGPHTKEAK